MRLDLPCEPASLRAARNAVATVAHQLGAAVDDVKIAVSEAVANVVVHAYRGGSKGLIKVFARPERRSGSRRRRSPNGPPTINAGNASPGFARNWGTR